MISETLSHYRILEPLGAGGMGVVYLAEDTRLRRKVALKLLPEAFTRDPQRLRRFEQEARAASALNHPNILTIFEIGQAEGAHFIATEFIDGQTLRERLRGGAVPIAEALDLAAQITAALAAAHEAGIVHRDIKPENVMVRRDGIAKVLDFGLAKLTESPTSVESEAPTIAQVNTDPGTVLGTASYMSPEQARGQEADARSDLFSLGVMLYEVIAGQAPFGGANVLEVVSEILKTEPAPLRQFIPDAPSELQRIVTKTLRKDREQRYQHAKDLLIDLKDLKQELEFEAKLKGAPTFGVPPSGGISSAPALPPEGGTPNATSAARTTSSAEIILGEIKRHRTSVLIGLAVLLVGAGLLGYGIYRFAVPKGTVARFQNVNFKQLTATGNVLEACISPDGKFIAYTTFEGGKLQLWTRSIVTNAAVRIVDSSWPALGQAGFSPDGNYVFFQVQDSEKAVQRNLYQVSVLGGSPKKIASNVRGYISFSPDGKQVAFFRYFRDLGDVTKLVIMSLDNGNERMFPREMAGGMAVSWSLDGQTIAVGASLGGNSTYSPMGVYGVDVRSGDLRPLTTKTWLTITSLAWVPDASGLLVIAYNERGAEPQIWQLSYPSGEVRRITNDFQGYRQLSLMADASSLLTVKSQDHNAVYLVPGGDFRKARPLPFRDTKLDARLGLSMAPDGRIVYVSTISGNRDIWMTDLNGEQPRQLTDSLADDRHPKVSPDGRFIIFVSDRSGRFDIWRMDSDGGNLLQLTRGLTVAIPTFTPDGRWVVFADSTSSTVPRLRKVSIEGGEPITLTDQYSYFPAVSPNNKWIASFVADMRAKVGLFPSEGGSPARILDSPARLMLSPRWSLDGRSLILAGNDGLWRLPIDGGPPWQILKIDRTNNEILRNFDVSRDGKQFLVVIGTTTSDAVLISEVK